jgi:hypothetical protein
VKKRKARAEIEIEKRPPKDNFGGRFL